LDKFACLEEVDGALHNDEVDGALHNDEKVDGIKFVSTDLIISSGLSTLASI